MTEFSDDNISVDETPEDALFKLYENMPYKDLAAKMVELREQSALLATNKTAIDTELDIIRLRVVPMRFAQDGCTSFRVEGVGRLSLTKDAYCTQLKDKQAELFEWMRANDYGDLIKDTINPSSLKALVKELFEDVTKDAAEFDIATLEEEPPKTKFDEITELVKFTPFMRASVTKS